MTFQTPLGFSPHVATDIKGQFTKPFVDVSLGRALRSCTFVPKKKENDFYVYGYL